MGKCGHTAYSRYNDTGVSAMWSKSIGSFVVRDLDGLTQAQGVLSNVSRPIIDILDSLESVNPCMD